MKRFVKIISLVLVLCAVIAMPAYAQTGTEGRASSFFAYHDTFLEKTGAQEFKIWFDVTACTSVTHLGVSEIEVYRSSNQQNWVRMRTYTYEYYPEMMDYNSGGHGGYVTYSKTTSGYYYKAYVTFYAKNSSGTGTLGRYTQILKM